MNEMITLERESVVVYDSLEAELTKEAGMIESKVGMLTVKDEADYQAAATMAKELKKTQKAIKAYWEPLRAAAKSTYDNILSRKKQMLDPLEAAEKALKGKMVDYTMEAEKKRIANEKAMRTAASAEAEKKLNEAAEAEAAGDMARAEYAMAEAEVMESISVSGCLGQQKVKTDGVSQSKTWRITGIDASKVPVNFGGVEIRPVDEKAVLRLIKESKGTIEIPGIKFEETISISVRS